MREMEGMSFRDIGDALGCDEGTARVHYFRARQTTKSLLEPDQTTHKQAKRTVSRVKTANPKNPNSETEDKGAEP